MTNDLRERVARAIDPEAFETHDTCLRVWERRRGAAYKAADAAIAEMGGITPDNAQEAARVLVRKMAQTWPKATHAAAKEFPHVGFITAAGVVGAALRAIAEGQDDD